MNYIISEEELRIFAEHIGVGNDVLKSIPELIEDFIAMEGIKPVEMVASGKLIIPFESEGFLINGEFIGEIFHDKFGDKSIRQIEIYIQKEATK